MLCLRKYKHYKKIRNLQGSRKQSGRRLALPRARTGRMARRRTCPVSGGQTHGNPIGLDGQPLKCHTCGSTERLRPQCNRQCNATSHNLVADYDFAELPADNHNNDLQRAIGLPVPMDDCNGEFGLASCSGSSGSAVTAPTGAELAVPQQYVDPLQVGDPRRGARWPSSTHNDVLSTTMLFGTEGVAAPMPRPPVSAAQRPRVASSSVQSWGHIRKHSRY